MEKFNLNNLSSYDFELLCRDIMEKKLRLDTELFTFKAGKDGGIDICSSEISNLKVMIQAKHYRGSKFSDLKKIMNNEKEKVQYINPKNYYLITSLKLSRKDKIEIIEIIGKNFMKDISHIISYEDINRFLDNPKNIDILKKHYKLWLFSTNVFELIQNRDILFDEEMFMCEIEEESHKFVKTDFYEKILKILNKENLVIIIGNPGTGKTTLSKMLVLNYIAEGYKIKISSINDISKIKQSLSLNKEEKQLILLDDFLGQHYLELDNKKIKEVYSTVKNIKKNYKNTKMILNSRIIILNEAKEEENKFNDFITEEENKRILVDTNEISYLDKAKILYNHLYFSGMGNDFFEEIKRDENYFKIIEHKNYNPRIIEYMTINNRFKEPKKYIKEFLKNLENPSQIWKSQFKKMNEEDRIFLFTLYSLTNYGIEERILKDVVNKRLTARNKDTTLNFFEKSLKKLIDSLITVKLHDNRTLISVLNPSVNDFLKNELKNNLNECSDIIENSIYIEQVLKILIFEEVKNTSKVKELIEEILMNKKFLELKTIYDDNNFIEEEYLRKIIEYEVKNKDIEKKVKRLIVKYKKLLFYYGLIGEKFFAFYKFYNLKEEFLLVIHKEKNEFERFLLDDIELEEYIQILDFLKREKINIEFIDIKNIMLSHIENKLEEKIEQYIEQESEDILDFLDKTYNYNWNNKELQNILKNKEVQIYLENQEKEIILKIQKDLEKIEEYNEEIKKIISNDDYKNIKIFVSDFQEEYIRNLIKDINEDLDIKISEDEIKESIAYCCNLFKEYSIKKNEIENIYYSNFENFKKIDQFHLEEIFDFSYEIFKENQKNRILEKFLEEQFYDFNIEIEDLKCLKLIIKEFNIIFEKKGIKKVEISKFEELFNKIFRQELEHNQKKEKIIELFEKNL